MNSLEGSILHITMPYNWKCDIVKIEHDTTIDTRLYILYEKITGYMHWAMPIYSETLMIKILGQIVVENGMNKLRINAKNIIKNREAIRENYILYAPVVRLFSIPSIYVIQNDRKEWNELCECINNSNMNVPIRKISNIAELKRYVLEFL